MCRDCENEFEDEGWMMRTWCEAQARKGTGTGMCNTVLDMYGNCPRASSHVVDVPLPGDEIFSPDPASVRMRDARDEAAERLLNAIFGVDGTYDSLAWDEQIEHERWEAEGGSFR